MKLLISVFLLAAAASAAEPKVIPLWPGTAPGSENAKWEEKEVPAPDGTRRITNVTRPTLTVYLPEAGTATGTAVIIAPGGGFRQLAIDHEGVELAHYLNSLGVAAFVLKYHLMQTGDPGEKDAATMAERRKVTVPLAIADGEQAMRLVRSRAAEWGLARDRIGIVGFSAGGHVAAAVTVHHDAESRPSFSVLLYPGTPEEIAAPSNAPPAFIVQADDDKTVPAG